MSLLTPAVLQLNALHMGALHAHERLLVLLVAFGPFVVLVAVVVVLRRRDVAAEAREEAREGPPVSTAQKERSAAQDRREGS